VTKQSEVGNLESLFFRRLTLCKVVKFLKLPGSLVRAEFEQLR